MENLPELRATLNSIDEKIIELLGKRYSICREVAYFKKANHIPMMQPTRVEEVKERCAKLAISRNVDPQFAKELYSLIIGEACRLEDKIIDASEPEQSRL